VSEHNLTDKQVTALKSVGFGHVTIVATKTQVATIGSVVGAFKSSKDATRFATVLNRTYGPGLYKGTPL
jgi:hypothetical protein